MVIALQEADATRARTFAPGRIVARLLGAGGDAARPVEAASSNKRRLYDRIGVFLVTHELDLTPLNFGCAHDYLWGGDRQLVDDIDAACDRQVLSNGWIEDYVARRSGHPAGSETMVEMATKVENELDRCLALMKRSADQANGYSQSLANHSQDGSPEQLIARVADLTREMIEKSRLIEAEMRESHSQVSQLRTTLRAARKASEIDHLTGLPNRRGFERRVGEICAAHGDRPMAIALCDVDNFKAVNDRFGHDTGDRVLKSIARELRLLRRRGCEVGRLGGEEFIVLLPDRTLEQAAIEVGRPREKMSGRSLIDSVTDSPIGTVTFSAGVAMVDGRQDLRRAMRLADAALYAAKHGGRNRIYGASAEGRLLPMNG